MDLEIKVISDLDKSSFGKWSEQMPDKNGLKIKQEGKTASSNQGQLFKEALLEGSKKNGIVAGGMRSEDKKKKKNYDEPVVHLNLKIQIFKTPLKQAIIQNTLLDI